MQSAAKSGTKELSLAQYQRLLKQLRETVEQGRARAEAAVARELVRTYHRVGSLIERQQLSGHAGYGSAMLQRLADDLGLNVRVLQQAVTFARCYPEGPPQSGLRWTHYRELIRVNDPRRRAWYEKQAAAGCWSRARLTEAIRTRQLDAPSPAGKRRPRRALPRPSEATYVYKARVERVVDGDTLLLLIDLGFQVLKRQRVRLAAIDTPPRDTPEGQRALELVQQELAGVTFVVIRTEKVDLYGRYVAHLFYAPEESDAQLVFAKGQYLNQLLVERGLAVPLGG
jgi:endonuclease YncB( thermonuclease family)